MKRTAFIAAGLLLGLLLVIVFSMQNDPHKDALVRCLACHKKDNSGRIEEHELTEPVSMLCRHCHQETLDDGYLHPVDIVPGHVSVPSDMPLSRSGTLTCSTCHDVHGEAFNQFGLPSYYLRRGGSGPEFCRACHVKGLSSPDDGHAALLGEAHFRSRYVVTDPSQEIDAISKNCISCHDGAMSQSASVRAGSWRHSRELVRFDGGNHPIGMDYETARMLPGRKSDLRPIAAVDRRIRFFDGKVGCGSCHDPYSSQPKKLVMDDRNSRLCFACHAVGRM